MLVVICAVIGFAMAAVNMLTAPKIAEEQLKKEQAALSAVLPDNQGFERIELDKEYQSVVAIYADKGSDALVVMLSIKGYDAAKPMSVAVGFDGEGKTTKISVISAVGETKGIGSKVVEEPYISSYLGIDSVDDIDTVTGATKSSRAFKKAMDEAISAVKYYKLAEVAA